MRSASAGKHEFKRYNGTAMAADTPRADETFEACVVVASSEDGGALVTQLAPRARAWYRGPRNDSRREADEGRQVFCETIDVEAMLRRRAEREWPTSLSKDMYNCEG